MKVSTNVKAGNDSSTNRVTANHNEKLASDKKSGSLAIKADVKAGGMNNHRVCLRAGNLLEEKDGIMNRFKNFILGAESVKQGAKNRLKRFRLALPIAIIGLMVIGTAHAQNHDDAKATVFQAAGPNASSIQSTVEQFRVALGGENNGIITGPLAGGRREINWDGGGTATTLAPTPLDNFLIGRGARFTTTGSGFVQAPASGLADVFGNPSYAVIFKPFSPVRLFSPIGSNVTDTLFFVPGGGEVPATTRGFGVVFSDIDLPDGSGPSAKKGNRHASTLIEFFSTDGKVLFSSFAPASLGDGNLTFFGIVFEDARIARVRITAGATPGPDDSLKLDVVMMDDFIYGEPQPIH
jgi:hypothetical protein